MPDALLPRPGSLPGWTGDLTRVPFWVYRDQALMKLEQDRVFEGPVWNFLCLENEIASPGDWRSTVVGQMPVVVARDTDGSIAAFENRCAHRGALICLDNAGSDASDFQCVYHAWRYDLRGNLRSVAFQRGVKGKGGMPPGFRVEDHGPRQLRVTTLHGLVFGTFSADTSAIEDFIGPDVRARFDRMLGGRKIEIIEQLEAVRGERPRFISCQPAAPVLRHVQAEPAEPRRRSCRQPERRLQRLRNDRADRSGRQELHRDAVSR
jgi:nitrite reductase/ring-hydroxylating ferredoxin subunit